ncbi:hypothetical protein PHSY_001080 [Pseudozyma hubeiensis SY62]|uniref:Uncharacterized protein n=1 Tax=Pseudozyma hubeiensis (strain SY62) TaxID=1305764 RepID=R9P5Y5_PSEHS|nr:hypothetical protein PHSY_001080 [Pseudozyma hubeiensis SY62]GAC93515.1 hypothetical protein PHSY_001080 [Pseudozyma hubeiensis SY62]
MSTTRPGRQYTVATSRKAAEAMYRQPSYDRSFDSVRYPSNTSQPSLSHSFSTYSESTPSSVCRPDFGDYPHNMSQSDCGASIASEVAASYDDTSDVDEVPVGVASSKSTLIKFVEPVVQRDASHGQGRLTGMKKKKMLREKAAQDGEAEIIHHLPLLGFSNTRTISTDDQALHKDVLSFPLVPPRDAHITPRQEEWNVDAIDIALEDLVLDKGKIASNGMRGAAAHSVLDEAQEEETPYHRSRALSDARRAQNLRRPPPPPPVDALLPPLPPLASAPTESEESETPSAEGKVAGLGPVSDHPLAETGADQASLARSHAMLALRNSNGSAVDSDDDVFAFRPPSLPGHGDEQHGTVRESRLARSSNLRLDSMASSNHSSLRDMDPREIMQRARSQALCYGLDAEIGQSLDVEAECGFASASSNSVSNQTVQAEDLPPLLSNHYLQGQVHPTEYERLNRLPERLLAAASSSGANALSHKHLSKHKKRTDSSRPMPHYEPISILRAEAAFLKEDVPKRKKKDRMWSGAGGNASSSDVSSVSDGHQRLKSFKSTMRLKKL